MWAWMVIAACLVQQSAPSCSRATSCLACTGAPPAAIAKRSGCGRRSARLRLSGGGSEPDEDGLPHVEFKLSESSPRFNVSLRCPFPVWRFLPAHLMRSELGYCMKE
jgi:hypothetical protein